MNLFIRDVVVVDSVEGERVFLCELSEVNAVPVYKHEEEDERNRSSASW